MSEKKRGKRKVLLGVVVGAQMDKTVRVELVRRFRHPMYKKFITSKKTYMAHDEKNECGVGDRVQIVESRPLSRHKRWQVRTVVEKAV